MRRVQVVDEGAVHPGPQRAEAGVDALRSGWLATALLRAGPGEAHFGWARVGARLSVGGWQLSGWRPPEVGLLLMLTGRLCALDPSLPGAAFVGAVGGCGAL
jgi:hypothetical protein